MKKVEFSGKVKKKKFLNEECSPKNTLTVSDDEEPESRKKYRKV
jgi:hypothetical protein